MAQPIALKIPPRDPKQELLTRLEQAPAEYAAALLDSYELLQQLHEHGVFTTVRGALEASDKLVEAASAGANSPEAIRIMRNGIILAKMLGSIDPEVLHGTCEAISQTFGNAKSVAYEPPSLFALFTALASRDLRRGMALISTLLKNLAYQLKIRTQSNRNH
ncbi:DUF1641 domain-containing protein [Acidicapsa acidisoli]|uniref:DUF1641 domain-containing protein n=1 Tax=Acidicapsa acidisoli TaxID=1615681 RepID=UPI0021E0B959|nr:DUF1641 domain-containing protein [Acidicapsa acidisoli]